MLIDRATVLEWPQIALLREEHLRRYPPLPWEAQSEAATWWVVRQAEKILAAVGYEDIGGIRWITDFLIADLPMFQRVRTALIMRDKLRELAKADRIPLAWQTRTDNTAQMRANRKRTRGRPLSVVFFEPYEE